MKKLTSVLFIFLCLGSMVYAQNATPAKAGSTYGEAVSKKGAFPIADLQQKMGNAESLNAKVSGKVVEVCTKKGCWMKLENADGETTRVTFKDYAFFMPENIVGKNVVLQGVSKLKTTSVADLQHYAEDAGKSKADIAKIITPKQEITFEANGVLVL